MFGAPTTPDKQLLSKVKEAVVETPRPTLAPPAAIDKQRAGEDKKASFDWPQVQAPWNRKPVREQLEDLKKLHGDGLVPTNVYEDEVRRLLASGLHLRSCF